MKPVKQDTVVRLIHLIDTNRRTHGLSVIPRLLEVRTSVDTWYPDRSPMIYLEAIHLSYPDSKREATDVLSQSSLEELKCLDDLYLAAIEKQEKELQEHLDMVRRLLSPPAGDEAEK